jgi:hypothetical protein
MQSNGAERRAAFDVQTQSTLRSMPGLEAGDCSGPTSKQEQIVGGTARGHREGCNGGEVTKEPERTVAQKRAMRQALSSVKASGEVRPVEEWPNYHKPRCPFHLF